VINGETRRVLVELRSIHLARIDADVQAQHSGSTADVPVLPVKLGMNRPANETKTTLP
jgi:hypothetical protein